MNRTHRNKSKRPTRKRNLVGIVKSDPPLHIGQGQYVPKLMRVSLRFGAQSDAKTPSLDLIRVSGNNIQDPLGSTGSGAPPGFSFWATMYERYRVIGSRIEVTTRISNDQKDTDALRCSGRTIVFPSNNTTSLASGSDYQSQPYAKTRSVTSNIPCRIVSTMKSATILGQKDVLGADRLQSQVTTGPADEWFWRVVNSPDTDFSTHNMFATTVTVTYDVEFFDRQPLDRSSITKHHEAAYLENCRQILEKNKLIEFERASSAARFEDKLFHSAEDPDTVFLNPLPSKPVVRAEKIESKEPTPTPKPPPNRTPLTPMRPQ